MSYYNTYTHNSEKLKTNGFFYRTLETKEYLPGGSSRPKTMLSPIYFFNDGVVANYSPLFFNNPDELVTNLNRHKPEWGYFKIEGDSVKIQTLTKISNFISSFRKDHDVIEYQGKILNDTTFVITKTIGPRIKYTSTIKSSESDILFRFYKSAIKPDSLANWIPEQLKKNAE